MRSLLLSLVFIILTSCVNPPSSFGDEGYPNPEFPEESLIVPKVISTPISTQGVVTGTLKSASGQSLVGLALYFGTLLPVTPGPDHLINLDLANSPKATINEDGSFIAENVPPGEYVLILWTPHNSWFVPDPANIDKELIVNVVGGQISDLKEITAPNIQ